MSNFQSGSRPTLISCRKVNNRMFTVLAKQRLNPFRMAIRLTLIQDWDVKTFVPGRFDIPCGSCGRDRILQLVFDSE